MAMIRHLQLVLIVLVIPLCLPGCGPCPGMCTEAVGPARAAVFEQPVVRIPLTGDVAERDAEVSGLAWYGDFLVILPQFPFRFPQDGHGSIFVLAKPDILAFLDGQSTEALAPLAVPFVAPHLAEGIPGYDGCEAIAFAGDRAFLSLEVQREKTMCSILLSGEMVPGLTALRVDSLPAAEIVCPARLYNMSYESLLVVGERLVALYEVNGANILPAPEAPVFDLALRGEGALPSPTLEYRITDATASDEDGRFWVVNFFYPGDRDKIMPAPDALAARDGVGPTHSQCEAVERLVEFRYTERGIECTETPVIQLQLVDDSHCRNWEGIVRLDDRGFLLMTDKYPETILAFVPAP